MLSTLDDFGLYLLRLLRAGQSDNELTVEGVEIGNRVHGFKVFGLLVPETCTAYNAILITDYTQDIMYPADLSKGAQITLNPGLLGQIQPTGELEQILVERSQSKCKRLAIGVLSYLFPGPHWPEALRWLLCKHCSDRAKPHVLC